MREHGNGARVGRGAELFCAVEGAALLRCCMKPQQRGNKPRACGSFLALLLAGHSRRGLPLGGGT